MCPNPLTGLKLALFLTLSGRTGAEADGGGGIQGGI